MGHGNYSPETKWYILIEVAFVYKSLVGDCKHGRQTTAYYIHYKLCHFNGPEYLFFYSNNMYPIYLTSFITCTNTKILFIGFCLSQLAGNSYFIVQENSFFHINKMYKLITEQLHIIICPQAIISKLQGKL